MSIHAYHFTANTLRDGRKVPAIGEKLAHEGEIEWCRSGLYASREAFDALQFAPGPRLHRVECNHIELEDSEKFVCRERTIIASIDATDLLRSFARKCALDVIHLWDAPQVVVDYLTSGDESKRVAAEAAARDAAEAAARVAAEVAARDAARAAAWAAAWDAAWTAAWAAARVAAEAAARDAARAAVWVAAEAAARDAARAAVWEWQRACFNELVNQAFEGATK